MPTYLLTIAYDGTCFHGWQRQAGFRSVQEELENAFAAIGCGTPHVEGAGRTDAGVHAMGQAAHVELERAFPLDRLPLALNANLPADVAVQAARLAPPGFHARFHARGKRYAYRCLTSPVRPAIGRSLYHWVRRPVDLAAMRQAAACLRGRHDFAAFATNPGYPRRRGTVRTLHHVHLLHRPGGFDFVVQGSGFLYNMVRNLVGSLLEIGYGNRPVEWLEQVLRGRDRRAAGATAPAAGLYLVGVLYAADLRPAGVEPGTGAEDAAGLAQ
ncbi:MAG: tRNA pseudouridine(38-40) synthase TruA [Planctomycetes bacterium]|nr:tRNA pseudouridine(38-40) synthase TruA [Planctomycetota bacterium]